MSIRQEWPEVVSGQEIFDHALQRMAENCGLVYTPPASAPVGG